MRVGWVIRGINLLLVKLSKCFMTLTTTRMNEWLVLAFLWPFCQGGNKCYNVLEHWWSLAYVTMASIPCYMLTLSYLLAVRHFTMEHSTIEHTRLSHNFYSTYFEYDINTFLMETLRINVSIINSFLEELYFPFAFNFITLYSPNQMYVSFH